MNPSESGKRSSYEHIVQLRLPDLIPGEQIFQKYISDLLTSPEATELTDIRRSAISCLFDITETAATWGIDAVSGAKKREFLDIGSLSPFHFPTIEADRLINLGVITSPLKRQLLEARNLSKQLRAGKSAETGAVVWVLSEDERGFLLEEPPNIEAILAAVKSPGHRVSSVVPPPFQTVEIEQMPSISKLSQFLEKAKREANSVDLNTPVIAIRESYTHAIPVEAIPEEILTKYDIPPERAAEILAGLEVDVKGLYLLATSNLGELDLFFLGETHVPHRHIQDLLGRDLRLELTDVDELQLANDIMALLKIKDPQRVREDFRATDQQVAAILSVIVIPVQDLLTSKPN